MTNDQQITNAWLIAAQDLGIQVEAPFVLMTKDGLALECLLLIKGFGSKKGTVILTENNLDHFNTPELYGYYCSALSLDYGSYNREMFISTLLDWGYYGEDGLRPGFAAPN